MITIHLIFSFPGFWDLRAALGRQPKPGTSQCPWLPCSGLGWWDRSWDPTGDPATPSSWPTLTETFFLGGGDEGLISWIYSLRTPAIISSRARETRGHTGRVTLLLWQPFSFSSSETQNKKGTRYIWANSLFLWKKEDLGSPAPTPSLPLCLRPRAPPTCCWFCSSLCAYTNWYNCLFSKTQEERRWN